MTPLHPFLIGVLALGAAALLERHRGRRMRTAWIVLCVAWVGLYSVVTATRIATDWPVGAYRIRAEHLAAAIESLERTAPEGAIVGAPEFWAALHLHGGWTVAPSVRFDPRSVDPQAPMWGTPEEQLSLWRTTGIDHLLLEQNGALHGATLDRLEDACPGTVFLLAQAPPLILVRLDRAGGCGLLADPAAAPPGG